MAVHDFTYTVYPMKVETVPRSDTDATPIIATVTVDLVAVDKADDTKTITMTQTKTLTHTHLQSRALPSGFIPLASVTTEKLIEWWSDGIDTDELDAFTTWQLYGWQEVDPNREE